MRLSLLNDHSVPIGTVCVPRLIHKIHNFDCLKNSLLNFHIIPSLPMSYWPLKIVIATNVTWNPRVFWSRISCFYFFTVIFGSIWIYHSGRSKSRTASKTPRFFRLIFINRPIKRLLFMRVQNTPFLTVQKF